MYKETVTDAFQQTYRLGVADYKRLAASVRTRHNKCQIVGFLMPERILASIGRFKKEQPVNRSVGKHQADVRQIRRDTD